MTLKRAIAILENDREFLGMDFATYIDFINTAPEAFGKTVIEAYKVYKRGEA